ncbi:hypothetical protein ACFX13_014705 [Malus domestica]
MDKSLKKFRISIRDFNGSDVGLLLLRLWNSHTQNSILHGRINLIDPCILRKLKPPQELATVPFHSVPLVVLVRILYVPLSADLKHPVVIHLHLHLLFPRQFREGGGEG